MSPSSVIVGSQSIRSRAPAVRRHTVLAPPDDAASPLTKRRRVGLEPFSYGGLLPSPSIQLLQTSEMNASPLSEYSDYGSIFSLPSYPNSALSSPLTPLEGTPNAHVGTSEGILDDTKLAYSDPSSLQAFDLSQLSFFGPECDTALYQISGSHITRDMGDLSQTNAHSIEENAGSFLPNSNLYVILLICTYVC